MIEQRWYSHNQAEQLAARLFVELGEMSLPQPDADAIDTLVDALVSVRKFHRDEDWRWLMPANSLGVTGIILTVGTFVLLCENNTRRHPRTEELQRRLLETPLTTKYDDQDTTEYVFGMATAVLYLHTQLKPAGAARLTDARIDAMQAESMPKWGKGNLAWRHGQMKVYSHLHTILSRTPQPYQQLDGPIFGMLTQMIILEAFAAEKPSGFDVSEVIAGLLK